ncbi:MAG: hypothetical protein ACR2JR_11205, partial [Rubrobacteraceae bacterium]
MDEFKEIRNKRQRFLKVVYDLAEGAPSTDVSGDDVAQRLDMELDAVGEFGSDVHAANWAKAETRRLAGGVPVSHSTVLSTLRATA